MTLEEVIKQRLAEAQKTITESAKKELVKDVAPEQVGAEKEDEVILNPKKLKESTTPKNIYEGLNVAVHKAYSGKVSAIKSDLEKSHSVDGAKLKTTEHGDFVHIHLPDAPHNTKDAVQKTLKSHENHPAYSANNVQGGSEKEVTKESSHVSDQVSALLEAEGLSDEFKEQAVTIFEAAVKDRVLQIEEGLKQEFENQLAEAKEDLENDIDGFLSETVKQWKADNEVAIKSNFKSQVAESFIDGITALLAEHNIELPEGKEDALETALNEVEKLNEKFSEKDQEIEHLQEQVNTLKAAQILESFKAKMTQTEFDRFSQLTESIKFKDEVQYSKQLKVVLENFGSTKKEVKKVVTEEVITEKVADVKIVTENNSKIDTYAQYLSKKH